MNEQEIRENDLNEEELTKLKIEKIEKYDQYIKSCEKDSIFFSITFGASFLATLLLFYGSLPFFKGDYKSTGCFIMSILSSVMTGGFLLAINNSLNFKNKLMAKKEILEEEIAKEMVKSK